MQYSVNSSTGWPNGHRKPRAGRRGPSEESPVAGPTGVVIGGVRASGRESCTGRCCGETGQGLPALVADECVYSSEGTGRSEYRVQCPLDLPSRVFGGAGPRDKELEEARGTHKLAAVIDAEELADFASDEVFDRVGHRVFLAFSRCG